MWRSYDFGRLAARRPGTESAELSGKHLLCHIKNGAAEAAETWHQMGMGWVRLDVDEGAAACRRASSPGGRLRSPGGLNIAHKLPAAENLAANFSHLPPTTADYHRLPPTTVPTTSDYYLGRWPLGLVAAGLMACYSIKRLPSDAALAPPSPFDGAAAGDARELAASRAPRWTRQSPWAATLPTPGASTTPAAM